MTPKHTVMYVCAFMGICFHTTVSSSLQTIFFFAFFVFHTRSAPSGERTSGALLIGSLVFLMAERSVCSVDCSEWPPSLCSSWKKKTSVLLSPPFSHLSDGPAPTVSHTHTHIHTHNPLFFFFLYNSLHLLDFNFFVNTVKCILISLTCFDIFKSRQQLIRKTR